jgi:hypothetical protein
MKNLLISFFSSSIFFGWIFSAHALPVCRIQMRSVEIDPRISQIGRPPSLEKFLFRLEMAELVPDGISDKKDSPLKQGEWRIVEESPHIDTIFSLKNSYLQKQYCTLPNIGNYQRVTRSCMTAGGIADDAAGSKLPQSARFLATFAGQFRTLERFLRADLCDAKNFPTWDEMLFMPIEFKEEMLNKLLPHLFNPKLCANQGLKISSVEKKSAQEFFSETMVKFNFVLNVLTTSEKVEGIVPLIKRLDHDFQLDLADNTKHPVINVLKPAADDAEELALQAKKMVREVAFRTQKATEASDVLHFSRRVNSQQAQDENEIYHRRCFDKYIDAEGNMLSEVPGKTAWQRYRARRILNVVNYCLYIDPNYQALAGQREEIIYNFPGVWGGPSDWERLPFHKIRNSFRNNGEPVPHVISFTMGKVSAFNKPSKGQNFLNKWVPQMEKELAAEIDQLKRAQNYSTPSTSSLSSTSSPKLNIEETTGERFKRYGLGVSLGGAGILHVMLSDPEFFSGVMAVCPALIDIDASLPFNQVKTYMQENNANPLMAIPLFLLAKFKSLDDGEFVNSMNPLTGGLPLLDKLTHPVYLSVGTEDDVGFRRGTETLYQLLQQRKIPVQLSLQETEESDPMNPLARRGGHCMLSPQEIHQFISDLRQGRFVSGSNVRGSKL